MSTLCLTYPLRHTSRWIGMPPLPERAIQCSRRPRPPQRIAVVSEFLLMLMNLALLMFASTGCTVDSDTAADLDGRYVRIPAGAFEMGATASQPDEGDNTKHDVTLTHDYFVGVTEVTQEEFSSLMGYNRSSYPDCDGHGGGLCPVETVTWHESAAYANAVSRAAGLDECYSCVESESDVVCVLAVNPYDCGGYRLLTEAEWEGAARCGTDTTYAGSDTASGVAWTSENSDAPQPVGGLAPNACGLLDMSGNVCEWTGDGYDDYPAGQTTNPIGVEPAFYRVIRGGCWNVVPEGAAVSARAKAPPEFDYGYVGIRLSRSVP